MKTFLAVDLGAGSGRVIAARFDGRPYRPAEPGFGILAAQTPELWEELQRRLFAEV